MPSYYQPDDDALAQYLNPQLAAAKAAQDAAAKAPQLPASPMEMPALNIYGKEPGPPPMKFDPATIEGSMEHGKALLAAKAAQPAPGTVAPMAKVPLAAAAPTEAAPIHPDIIAALLGKAPAEVTPEQEAAAKESARKENLYSGLGMLANRMGAIIGHSKPQNEDFWKQQMATANAPVEALDARKKAVQEYMLKKYGLDRQAQLDSEAKRKTEADIANMLRDDERTKAQDAYNKSQDAVKFENLVRHEKAMEARPPGMPYIVVGGQNGEQYIANPLQPNKPATPVMDAEGKPILKANPNGSGMSQKEWDAMQNDLKAGRSNPIVREQEEKLANIAAARGVMTDKDGKLKPLTPQFLREAFTAYAKVVSGGGAPSEKQIEELTPHTRGMDWANKLQYYTNHPHDADVGPFLKMLKDSMDTQVDVAHDTLAKARREVLPKHWHLRQSDPGRFDAMLSGFGMDPNQFNEQGLYAPPATAAGANAWSPDKEKRLQELRAKKAAGSI